MGQIFVSLSKIMQVFISVDDDDDDDDVVVVVVVVERLKFIIVIFSSILCQKNCNSAPR